MFLVQPPADLWLLAWLAPLPWLALGRRHGWPRPRPWLAVWCGGLTYWLPAIHWLRLPHPATADRLGAALGLPGLLSAALRLAGAPAACIAGGGRSLPAATVAWVACEQLRGSCSGGFTFAGLGHTQWRWTTLIQTADTVGEVGVGGIVMAGAAGLAAGLLGLRRRLGRPLRRCPVASAGVAVVAAAIAYGHWRLATALRAAASRSMCCSCRARSIPSSNTIRRRRPTCSATTTAHDGGARRS